MSRRHAFRPDALDILEGRLAPGAFLISSHAAPAHPAKAVQKPKAKSSAINVDWNKLGTQVTDFLGITHKAKPHPVAHKPAATGRLLPRG